MKKILIDTNIYSHAFRGTEDVIETLRKADEIGLTVISIGELFAGFKGGGKEKENLEELEEFLDSPRVVVYNVDDQTSGFYANVFHNLKKAGTPIPTNDIWIAAIAFQHGLTIFTKDIHFNHVAGLSFV